MKKSSGFVEFEIHDLAIEILYEEIKIIKRKKVRSDEELIQLDKMVRTYAVLMDNLRSNIKDKLAGSLSQGGDIGDSEKPGNSDKD